MKILICFILFSMLNVSGSIFSQSATFDLAVNGKTVKEVFKDIEGQSPYRFLYNDDFSGLNRVVSFNTKDNNINEVLNQLLVGAQLTYRELENDLIVITPLEIREQQQVVSGIVTESLTGQPLPGVSVYIRGTSIGTVTDVNGNYQLSNVPPDAILVFSFVGMIPHEIALEGRTTINVVLEEDRFGIEEVVAVGYGTIRRSDITGSVGIVTKDELDQQSSVNVLQSLRGKIPGVNIFTNSGSPTGDNRVLIRGVGTINASASPLFIVDGVAMDDIQFLNPNDIVSVQVLKDASSAAIYGSRGSNGVVMIQTERGGRDGLSVGYSVDVSAGHLRKPLDLQNAEEFMEMIKIGYENAPKFRNYAPGQEPVIDLSDPNLFDAQGNPLYDTDWQSEAMRTALSHDHQFSIQYGSENHSMGFFVNYSDRQGIILNTYLERLSLKFAFDSKLTDWLSAGAVLTTNNINENFIFEDFGSYGGPGQHPFKTIGSYVPIMPVKWPDGSWANQTQQTRLPRLNGFTNPVHDLTESDRLRDRSQLFGNTYANFQISPNLEFRSEFGFNNEDYEARTYYASDMVALGFPDGNGSIANSRRTYWQSENYFTYLNVFGQHRVNSMLGASWQESSNWAHSVSARGFPNDFYRFNLIGSATNPQPPNSSYNDWTMESYFTRVNYSYKNTYSATFTARIDGSSRFGSGNKFGFFPSAGVSWMVSNEDFMSGLNFVDMFRLRTSYGVTGNTEIGTYQSLATIAQGTTLIGGSRQPSSFIQRLPNPDLRWERSTMLNIGTELILFDHAVSLEADYYYKLTDDLLYARPVPSSTGFNTILDNIGSVSNRGIDLIITTNNIRRSDFSWSTTFSLNHNRNRVEGLGLYDEDIFPGPNYYGASNTILRVGEPIGSFWGLVRYGTWNTDEAAEAALAGRLPGMAKRSDEREILGKGYPDFTGSFINRVNIGNFDFTFDLQFVYGVEIYQQFLHVHDERMGIEPMFRTAFYNAWTPENQDTKWPQIRHLRLSGANPTPDSGWVSDGSYLRGNLFAVGYTFDRNILAPMGISQLRLAFSVENLFVIHSDDFLGYDPESSSSSSRIHNQNVFQFNYPKPRTFVFGLNVQF